MTTKSQDGMLGLTLLALLVTVGGETLGMPLLVAIGVTSFFLAVGGLMALMTISLILGLRRTTGPDMRDSLIADSESFVNSSRKH
jgi:hypothetical protein